MVVLNLSPAVSVRVHLHRLWCDIMCSAKCTSWSQSQSCSKVLQCIWELGSRNILGSLHTWFWIVGHYPFRNLLLLSIFAWPPPATHTHTDSVVWPYMRSYCVVAEGGNWGRLSDWDSCYSLVSASVFKLLNTFLFTTIYCRSYVYFVITLVGPPFHSFTIWFQKTEITGSLRHMKSICQERSSIPSWGFAEYCCCVLIFTHEARQSVLCLSQDKTLQSNYFYCRKSFSSFLVKIYLFNFSLCYAK